MEKNVPARLVVVAVIGDEDGAVLLCKMESTEYAWVRPGRLLDYDLNAATRSTFETMGLLPTTNGPS